MHYAKYYLFHFSLRQKYLPNNMSYFDVAN